MGPLSRWSQRKLKTREDPPADEVHHSSSAELLRTDSPEAMTDDEPDELTAGEQAEILRQLELAPPETLKAGDDFTAYLCKEVPIQIRRRALAQLWRSNPVLANLDGLVDYGEDFTDAATVVDNLTTAYQVGRGIVLPETRPKPIAGTDATAAAIPTDDATDNEPPATSDDDSAAPVAESDTTLPDTAANQEAADPATVPSLPASQPEQPPLARTMKFRFDNG